MATMPPRSVTPSAMRPGPAKIPRIFSVVSCEVIMLCPQENSHSAAMSRISAKNIPTTSIPSNSALSSNFVLHRTRDINWLMLLIIYIYTGKVKDISPLETLISERDVGMNRTGLYRSEPNGPKRTI